MKLIRAKNFYLAFGTQLALLITWTLPVHAQQVVTLQQAVALALERNPALAAARSETTAAQFRITQSKAAYLPQVNLSGAYEHGWTEAGQGARAISGADQDSDTYSTGLTVSQHLFDFGSTRGQLDQSRFNAQASQAGFDDTTKNLVSTVKQAFFEVLKNERLVEVGQQDLDVRLRHLDQAKALAEQGLQPRIDVLRSETEVSRARLQLVQAQYSLQKTRVALERLWGGPPVEGPYTLAAVLDPPWSPSELQPLIDLALDARSDIAQIRAQVKSAEAALWQTKGGSWPSLSANGSYRYTGEDYPLDNSWSAAVELRWELFTGLRRSAQISEKKVDIQRIEALLQSRQDSVSEQVTQAFLALQEIQEIIENARIGLKQATENLAMAQGRYTAGVSGSLEYFDAQILYTEAQNILIQAEFDHYKASAELEYAVGVDPGPPMQ